MCLRLSTAVNQYFANDQHEFTQSRRCTRSKRNQWADAAEHKEHRRRLPLLPAANLGNGADSPCGVREDLQIPEKAIQYPPHSCWWI